MAAIVILLAKINQNTFVKPQKITLIIGIGKNTDYYSVVADSWSLIKRLVKFFLKNVTLPTLIVLVELLTFCQSQNPFSNINLLCNVCIQVRGKSYTVHVYSRFHRY